MKAKTVAISALALSTTLSSTAQAGFFEREYHKQRVAHHIQEAAYHHRRYDDNKEDLHEAVHGIDDHPKWHTRWHRSRMNHHWEEYQEHTAKVKYHKAELAEEGYRYHQ